MTEYFWPLEEKEDTLRKRKGNWPDMKYRHALSAPKWRKYLEDQENLKITNLMEKKASRMH